LNLVDSGVAEKGYCDRVSAVFSLVASSPSPSMYPRALWIRPEGDIFPHFANDSKLLKILSWNIVYCFETLHGSSCTGLYIP
jgi:hypothetical protein